MNEKVLKRSERRETKSLAAVENKKKRDADGASPAMRKEKQAQILMVEEVTMIVDHGGLAQEEGRIEHIRGSMIYIDV